MVYQLEKMLKDNGEKLSDEDKKKLEEAIQKAKKDFETDDIEKLKKSLEELTQISNEVFTKMYQSASSQTSNDSDNSTNSNNGDNPEEVIID